MVSADELVACVGAHITHLLPTLSSPVPNGLPTAIQRSLFALVTPTGWSRSAIRLPVSRLLLSLAVLYDSIGLSKFT